MNKKVSIIVPVYNAEMFLNKCIDSIINQTYKNIEIILINDGSKDNSLKIMKKYADKYKNIKYFTQFNKGPGETRNRGIKVCSGDYVTFVDSDDYIEPDYIQRLVENCNNNDIVVCGYKRYDQNGKLVFTKKPQDKEIDYLRFIFTVCKLYNRNFLLKNKILFTNRKIGEDMLFTLNCYSKTDKIKFISSTGYCNIENLHSITHTVDKKNKADMFDLVKEIDCSINLKKYKDLYLYFYLKTIIMNLLMQPKEISFEEYYNLYLDSFKWLEEVYKKENKKIKFKWIKGEDFKINLCVNLFILMKALHLSKLFLYLLKKINIKL